jgi:hypothetical protein
MSDNIIKVGILLSLCYGCNHELPHEGNNNKIDISANIENLSENKLSRFTDEISYIPLQSKDFISFSADCNFDFHDSLILIYSLNNCFLYNYKGDLVSIIGEKSIGPGEYLLCIKAAFSDHRSVYVQSTLHDLSEYDFEGNLIRKYTDIFRISINNDDGYRNWANVFDSLIIVPVPNSTGKELNKAIIINKKGHILFAWINYDIFNRYGLGSVFERKSYLYSYNGKMHFRQYFNDTLFTISRENRLNPKYVFNLGEYKMPLSVRAGRFGGSDLWKYISIEDIFETDDILLIKCFFGNRFPARRLTPRETPGGESWYTTTYMLGLFQKNSGEFSFFKPESTDNPLNATGIINDIDGGPRFFPQKMVNDSVMVMAVEAKQLKDHIASDDFRKTRARNSVGRKKLEDLVSSINPLDNPILMFVTFKSKEKLQQ